LVPTIRVSITNPSGVAAAAGSSSRGSSTSTFAAVTKQRSAGVKNSSQKTKINVDNANESAQSHHITEGHSNDCTSRRQESTSTAAEVAGNMVNPLVQLIVDELLAYVCFYRTIQTLKHCGVQFSHSIPQLTYVLQKSYVR